MSIVTPPRRRIGTILAALAVTISLIGCSSQTTLSKDQAAAKITAAQTTHADLTKRASAADSLAAKLAKQTTLLEAEVAKGQAAQAKAESTRAAAKSSLASAQSAASASAASAQAASQAAAASQAQAASAAAAQARQQQAQTPAASGHAPVNNGDMNTAATGRIVGNANSKIYHVPGQAGYRMNSANAVYFNSEAEAQAAGYRKSLR